MMALRGPITQGTILSFVFVCALSSSAWAGNGSGGDACDMLDSDSASNYAQYGMDKERYSADVVETMINSFSSRLDSLPLEKLREIRNGRAQASTLSTSMQTELLASLLTSFTSFRMTPQGANWTHCPDHAKQWTPSTLEISGTWLTRTDKNLLYPTFRCTADGKPKGPAVAPKSFQSLDLMVGGPDALTPIESLGSPAPFSDRTIENFIYLRAPILYERLVLRFCHQHEDSRPVCKNVPLSDLLETSRILGAKFAFKRTDYPSLDDWIVQQRLRNPDCRTDKPKKPPAGGGGTPAPKKPGKPDVPVYGGSTGTGLLDAYGSPVPGGGPKSVSDNDKNSRPKPPVVDAPSRFGKAKKGN